MAGVKGVYGGVSAEDRRADRRARLLEAGLELTGTGGRNAATVRAICRAADLTPRYFYESFADREALLAALLDELVALAADRVLAAVAAAPDDAEAKSRAAIGAFVDLLVEDPRRARVLFSEAIGSEVLMERRLVLMRGFAALMAAQARAFYATPESEDDPVVETTALLLTGGLAEVLLAWLRGDLGSSRDQLVEDVAALYAAAGDAALAIARRRREWVH